MSAAPVGMTERGGAARESRAADSSEAKRHPHPWSRPFGKTQGRRVRTRLSPNIPAHAKHSSEHRVRVSVAAMLPGGTGGEVGQLVPVLL